MSTIDKNDHLRPVNTASTQQKKDSSTAKERSTGSAKAYVPFIAPPNVVSVKTVVGKSTWAKPINDYEKTKQDKLEEMAKDYKYYGIGFDLELSAAQNAKLLNFNASPERIELIRTARTLFLDTFNKESGELDAKKLKIFMEFVKELENAGVYDKDIAKVIRLSGKDLTTSDRKLAVEFVLFDQSGPIRQKVIDRLVQVNVDMLESYDGKIDPYQLPQYKSMSNLYYAVNHDPESTIDREVAVKLFKDPKIKKFIKEIGGLSSWYDYFNDKYEAVRSKKADAGSQTSERSLVLSAGKAVLNGVEIIKRRAFDKKVELEFNNTLTELAMASSQAHVGSSTKIDTFRAASLMQNIGILGGLSFMEYTKMVARYGVPSSSGYTPDDKFINDYVLADSIMSAVKDSPEYSDNAVFKDEYIDLIKETVKQINRTNNPYEKEVLLTVLSSYSGYLNDFKISIDDYLELLKPLIPPKREQPLKMGDLNRKIQFVRTEDLPKEMVDKFKSVGAWENIKKAPVVVLVHSIADSKSIKDYIGGASGQVVAGSILMLDVYDDEKKALVDLDQLTSVAAHEGQHIKEFYEHYSDPIMLASTVNERAAFITEMNTDIMLLKQLKNIDPQYRGETATMLGQAAHQARKAVIMANKVIGFKCTDYSMVKDVPDRMLDLSFYPTVAFSEISPKEELNFAEKVIDRAGVKGDKARMILKVTIGGNKTDTNKIDVSIDQALGLTDGDMKKIDESIGEILTTIAVKYNKKVIFGAINALIEFLASDIDRNKKITCELKITDIIGALANGMKNQNKTDRMLENLRKGNDPFYGI